MPDTVRPALRFGVAHDFRCPPGSEYTMADVYAQTMEQIALVDRLGLDLVWFSEHHFVEDGYLPNFVPVAAAAAAVTSRIRIGTNIALAPFAHPLRLAEDMGILDQLSNGRMELGLGLGYAPHEFAAFGMPRSHRVSYTEEAMEIMRAGVERRAVLLPRQALVVRRRAHHPAAGAAGWPAAVDGVDQPGRASPGPCASTPTCSPRASPPSCSTRGATRPRAAGRDPDAYRIGIIRSVLVTDDPERDWPPVRAAERYRMKVYGGFAEAAGLGQRGMFDPTAERIPQRIIIGDVAHCVDELCAFITRYGLTDVVTWGAVPGIAPAATTPMIERFAAEVVPQVKARLSP